MTDRAALVAVLAVALGARFWNLPACGFTHWDEHFYVEQARRVAAGTLRHLGWLGGPVHTLVMAAVMKLLGPSDLVALSVSAASGALACVATALVGRACWNARTGIFAGLLLAVSPFAVMHSRMALADSLFLLLFAATLWCIWEMTRRGSLRMAVAGGAVAGLLTMTKYNGVYAVVLAGVWLTIATCWPARLAVPRALALMACWLAAFVLMLAGLLLLIIPREGIAVVQSHFADYTSQSTEPAMILAYLREGTAAPVIVACAGGVALTVWRRSRGAVFLLIVAASFFAAVTRYAPYPRLGLPLMVPIVVFAAIALDALVDLARPRRGVAAIVGAVAIASQAWLLPPLLTLRTRGYADLARFLQQQPPDVDIWMKTQPNLFLYIRPSKLECDRRSAEALAADRPRLFVFDQVATWTAVAGDLLRLNADRLESETTLPNPMYWDLLLQPFTWVLWNRRHDPPPEYRQFRVIRTRGPLDLPAECWEH